MIVRPSPPGGNFFDAVKSFDANITISGNVVLNAKNLIVRLVNWYSPICSMSRVYPPAAGDVWRYVFLLYNV